MVEPVSRMVEPPAYTFGDVPRFGFQVIDVIDLVQDTGFGASRTTVP